MNANKASAGILAGYLSEVYTITWGPDTQQNSSKFQIWNPKAPRRGTATLELEGDKLTLTYKTETAIHHPITPESEVAIDLFLYLHIGDNTTEEEQPQPWTLRQDGKVIGHITNITGIDDTTE